MAAGSLVTDMLTFAMLEQTVSLTVILLSAAKLDESTVTFLVTAEVVPQLFSAATEIVPPPVPELTCMALVLFPPVTFQPPGKVQLYWVAAGSFVTDIVRLKTLEQTVSIAVIAEGVAGGKFSVTLTETEGRLQVPLPTTSE